MTKSEADIAFLDLILRHEERTGTAMPIDSLIMLSRLRHERRLISADLISDTQKSEQAIRTTLEKLVEAALIEAHGTGRGRAYTLSAKVYRQAGQKAAYIRQTGFEPIQQEQMVLKFIEKNGSIKRADAADLCQISPFQASRLLKRLTESGKIISKGKGTVYVRRS
ncbi:MAG: hypothetical protein ISS67_07450 [Desulfobacterales bacterium]|uniref:Uncharacterized protein n=1 Tax=Candidatus Desulfatibia profunda TaxID=2841695 RepID=A0A8J6NV52_9BACT|nr:hypothetical protein [Candidatus Desulfatibia profunda]MBL7179925.1 hypothetical protein [Desulfobacterales bacterium]MBL7208335.1 hypothetical protein [Desulfobacterales bacterium]